MELRQILGVVQVYEDENLNGEDLVDESDMDQPLLE